ncbi:MAG: hypothetical protein EOP69_01645, partial [Spirochaetia bacterium]
PLDDAIMDHLRAARISPEEAYEKSLDKKKFRVFRKETVGGRPYQRTRHDHGHFHVDVAGRVCQDAAPPGFRSLISSTLLAVPVAVLHEPPLPFDLPQPAFNALVRRGIRVPTRVVEPDRCETLLMVGSGWMGDKSLHCPQPFQPPRHVHR